MGALDVHGLLVGDDLDPALDLQDVSICLISHTVGALTSGMSAVLQSAAVYRLCVGRLRDFRRVRAEVVRLAQVAGRLDATVGLAERTSGTSGTSGRRSATALCLAACCLTLSKMNDCVWACRRLRARPI